MLGCELLVAPTGSPGTSGKRPLRALLAKMEDSLETGLRKVPCQVRAVWKGRVIVWDKQQGRYLTCPGLGPLGSIQPARLDFVSGTMSVSGVCPVLSQL